MEIISVAEEFGLPNLVGTERQIKWAMSIRDKYLGQTFMVRREHPQLYRESMAWLRRDYRARDATFYIEHRALDLALLMALVSGPER